MALLLGHSQNLKESYFHTNFDASINNSTYNRICSHLWFGIPSELRIYFVNINI